MINVNNIINNAFKSVNKQINIGGNNKKQCNINCSGSSVTVNGTTCSGRNLSIINNEVYIDGVKVDNQTQFNIDKHKTVEVKVFGSTEDIQSNGSVYVEGDCVGDINAGDSITIKGDVHRSVTAGDEVVIEGNVNGHINAGDSVTVKGNHKGAINAGDSVRVGSISK